MIPILQKLLNDDCTFIDIGAYIGEFSKEMLKSFPNAKGILFEPTYNNYEILKDKFMGNPNIDIINCALDNKAGLKYIYLADDSAQNSLLMFESDEIKFNTVRIKTETLDNHIKFSGQIEKIDFIKVDTQGNDLNVLKGGIDTIKKNNPVILTEFIFLPLYKQQGSYYDQFEFMDTLDYKLVGIYNAHNKSSGCLAFADLLFVPSAQYEKVKGEISTVSNFFCTDMRYLLEENKKLNLICNERLQLINRLTKEAEERLKIITILTAEIDKLKKKSN